MKRLIIIAVTLIVAIPLSVCLIVGISYSSTTSNSVPSPSVGIIENSILPAGYHWQEPVFGGLVYKEFEQAATIYTDIGVLNRPYLDLEMPQGYSGSASITLNSTIVWNGTTNELSNYQFVTNGNYKLDISCENPVDGLRGYGQLEYRAAFTVDAAPRVELGASRVPQGGVAALRVYNLPQNTLPLVYSSLSDVYFQQTTQSIVTVMLPVAADASPGTHEITVKIAQHSFSFLVDITTEVFETQDIEDAYTGWPPANRDDALAYPESAADISPLLVSPSSTIYCNLSEFLPPVGDADIIDEYGFLRYMGAYQAPLHHTGIDYDVPVGTEVLAPASGMVVFAGSNTSLGNVVVIEHGGGLKSLFFYLDDLDVDVGFIVPAGGVIGTSGQSGYAEQPHLHYELRLGETAINPNLFFEGEAAVFGFPPLP